MKLSPSICAVLVSVLTSVFAAPPKQTIPKETALKAIMTFRVDPLSEDARQAAAVVLQFVDQSHDVIVKISPKTMPFLSNKFLPEKHRAILLTAFVVGNVDSQLLRHQKKDDSCASALQLSENYRQMQSKSPNLRIAEVEKFMEMQKRGDLKA
jgi:hypothetical protein